MSKRKPEHLLKDILNALDETLLFVADLDFEKYLQNAMAKKAVERNLEIIGEAANRLPDEFKTKNDRVDWALIRGFRNRLAHEYFRLDHRILWQVVQDDLPILKQHLSAIKFD